jgi:hypothetical protein
LSEEFREFHRDDNLLEGLAPRALRPSMTWRVIVLESMRLAEANTVCNACPQPSALRIWLAHSVGADAIGSLTWLDGVSDQLQGWLAGVVERGDLPASAIKDVLNGVWLGHPSHPAVTDIPMGAWWTSLFLDLLGLHDGADRALLIGTLAGGGAGLTGIADRSDTSDKTRRVGLIHGLLNASALVCCAASLLTRRARRPDLAYPLSMAGVSRASFAAWLAATWYSAKPTW